MTLACRSLSWSLRLLSAVQFGFSPRGADGYLKQAIREATSLGLSNRAEEHVVRVDALRRRLAASEEAISVVDYGAGPKGGRKPPERSVKGMARRASTGPAWGRFLASLAERLGARRVLELGTNLGLSAAYLASGLQGHGGTLVTLEGDPTLSRMARKHLDGLGQSEHVAVITGPFAETLGPTLHRFGPFDLVFVDGHHDEHAALEYVEAIDSHLSPSALTVLDDVEPGRAVWRAWRRLRRERSSLYLGKLGLLLASSASPRDRSRGTPSIQRRSSSSSTISRNASR